MTTRAMILALVALSAGVGCGSGEKQRTYCDYQRVPCMSRDELAKVLTHLPGSGEVVSIDEGPWIETGVDEDGGAACCYKVTYKPEPS